MSQVILEKLDAIEAKQAESVAAVEAKIPAAVEAVKAEFSEMVAALEAKVSAVQAAPVIKIAKTVRGDVNRSVKEQIASYYKGGRAVEKELKMFEDESQYDAYLAEASALTGGGADNLAVFKLIDGEFHLFLQ